MSKKGKWRQVLAVVLTCSMLFPALSAAAAQEGGRETKSQNSVEMETEELEISVEGDSEKESQTETEGISQKEQESKKYASELGKNYIKGSTGREQVNFNREWKFIRNDIPGAEAVGYDDSEWVDIGIPHNFSIPYEMQASFYVGYGWYRKEFEVPADWDHKKVELEFEGVFQEAEVFVNGQALGTHRGGYSGFVYDITDHLQQGSNLIAVRVNNIWQPDLAPRAGDHQFTGGIYRDVYLNVTDDVHVTWYGTYVTTPDLMNPGFDASAKNVLDSYTSEAAIRENIDKKQSNVSVNTEVKNDSSETRQIKVKQEVVDQEDKVVAVFESQEQQVAPGSVAEIIAVSEKITGIQLWSPENPYIYKVYTTVYSNAAAVDTYESSFGFRWAQYKNDGFYLNGEKVLLNGANVHQDHAGFADAVTNEGFQRDVSMIKDCGMNFIRGSHYPHDPSFAEACDEQGIMFWSECNYWGMGGCDGKDEPAAHTSSDWFKDAYPQNPADEAAFEQSCLDSLEAMIRVNRNHPSIINWSMGNEVFFTKGGQAANPTGTALKARNLVDKMRNFSHELDPSRKAGMGGVQRGNYADLAVCDIAGYNGDGGKFVNNWMPNVVAEYGSKVADRPGEYRPFYDAIEGADKFSYKLQAGSAGLVLWCGFHHGTIGGDGLAKMGMIDYYRLPLNSWYWYREQNEGIAQEASVAGTASRIEITSSEDKITNDGKKDTQLIVTMTDSNGKWVNETKAVTLKVESGPGIFPGGKTYKFVPNKSIRDGKASIEFRSYYSGDTVISATADGLPVSKITVHTESTIGEEGTEPEDFYNADKWGSVTAKIDEPALYGGNNAASARPSFPSSNVKDSALAADGNMNTSWTAEKSGSGEYFMVDLEFTLFLYKLNLGFSKAPYPYKIETAMDKNGPWTVVAEYDKDTVSSRKQEETLDGVEARYVKVTFSDVPQTEKAFLSELAVYGNPSSVTPQYAMDSVYLSDVVDYNSSVTTGYGQKGKDLSCEGKPVKVGGVTYKKGIGLHANSTVSYKLEKKYTRISGVAGIDNEVTGGNAIFRIFADSSLIYEKELSGGEADEFNLSVNGVTELRMVTDNNGDSSQDHTDWADVKLYGAIRDISKAESGMKASYVGMSAGLRAGEDFSGEISLTNTTESEKQICASFSLYNGAGKLAGYSMSEETMYAKASKNLALTLPMPPKMEGYEGRISVWDKETMELLANTVILYPDPRYMESTEKTVTTWSKVDGEDSSLSKVGAWKLWADTGAYGGSETFIGDPGNPVQEGDYAALTFTGNYIRVGAKVDGGQVGADVWLDGVKIDRINNNGSANAYQEVYASERLESGQHTIKLVPTGKFGLDYFEFGVETVSGGGGEEPDADHPILAAMSPLTKQLEAGTLRRYALDGRRAVSEALMAAYGVYQNPSASDGDINGAAAALTDAVKNLKEKEDTAALADAAANAGKLIEKGQGNYTLASWNALKNAYQAALQVLEKADPSAAEIAGAMEQLTSALNALKEKEDTSGLAVLLAQAKAILAKGQGSYTDTSFANLKAGSEAAEKILAKAEPSAAEIKGASDGLRAAISGLQKKPDTSLADARKALQTEINKSSAIVKKGQLHYITSGFRNLKNSLTAAQKVFSNNKSALTQLQLARISLAGARNKLAVYKLPGKGKIYTVGSLKYKVTKSKSTGGTVCVTGAKKKTDTKVTVPSVIKINSYSFKVTEIGKKAFYKNGKLKTVVIGNNVSKIGDEAFYKNTVLRSVTIGTGLTGIGKSAFRDDRSLKSMVIKSSRLKTVGKDGFKKIYSKISIKVPAKKLNAYKKLFKSKGLPSLARVTK